MESPLSCPWQINPFAVAALAGRCTRLSTFGTRKIGLTNRPPKSGQWAPALFDPTVEGIGQNRWHFDHLIPVHIWEHRESRAHRDIVTAMRITLAREPVEVLD